jgi:oligoendopeptidase F
VFERLLAEATKDERRGLLAGKIEDGLNTVVRQIAFHRFETPLPRRPAGGRAVARADRRPVAGGDGREPGPGRQAQPGYEHYWAYVSHFVHAPFYVYAYAFGDLLVRGLMEKRREDPETFAPAVRGAARGRRHQDLRRGAGPVRPEPAREGVLGGGHEAA